MLGKLLRLCCCLLNFQNQLFKIDLHHFTITVTFDWHDSSREGGLACTSLIRVFSDVLVALFNFDICHYRQSNLAIENPEFSKPVVAVLSMKNMVIKWKIGDIKR